jgi:hypothetical protein
MLVCAEDFYGDYHVLSEGLWGLFEEGVEYLFVLDDFLWVTGVFEGVHDFGFDEILIVGGVFIFSGVPFYIFEFLWEFEHLFYGDLLLGDVLPVLEF